MHIKMKEWSFKNEKREEMRGIKSRIPNNEVGLEKHIHNGIKNMLRVQDHQHEQNSLSFMEIVANYAATKTTNQQEDQEHRETADNFGWKDG